MRTEIVKLINKGDKVKSKRTGEVMECYNVSTVYVGHTNELVRYEYSFVRESRRMFTMKQRALQSKLQSAWIIVNPK